MRWNPTADGERCQDCGARREFHDYHCTQCGMVTTKVGTCACGKCEMPEPSCECEAGWILCCPEWAWFLTEEEYAEIQEMKSFCESYPTGKEIAGSHKWEWDTAAMLRLKLISLAIPMREGS